MRLASLAPLTLAILVGAGCGARTGEDELLTSDLSAGGSTAVGGAGGTGGLATGGVGGFPITGGASAGGAGGGVGNPCCQVSAGRGCDLDPDVASCVCASDPFCCSGAWDATCVEEIEEFGCGVCSSIGTGGASSGGAGGGPPVGDCCSIQPGAGCSEVTISDCVCDFDRYCCQTQWDATCVSEVAVCGASCSVGTGGTAGTGGQGAGGGPGTGGAGPDDCCVAHTTPGCFDQGVQDCVCGYDDFCCDSAWDATCVEFASACTNDGCGSGGAATGGASGTGGSGAVGSGGMIGTGGDPATGGSAGAGGMGAGGASACDYFPSGCEQCVCNSCYDPLLDCFGDEGCSCILTSGCSGIADCLSDDNCGAVLQGGNAFASVALAYQLATCQSNSGCPCY